MFMKYQIFNVDEKLSQNRHIHVYMYVPLYINYNKNNVGCLKLIFRDIEGLENLKSIKVSYIYIYIILS